MKTHISLNPLAACIKAAMTGGTLMLLATASHGALAQEPAGAEKKAEKDVEKIVVVG